ncbi:pheromone processing endoprotease [Naganishia albida]|nr:pheromone processing endoprotease [Naganishia albida]
MKPVTALALLLAVARQTIATPSPRTYDTHHYFSLETDPASSVESASALAAHLGVQLVERIGELEGHWLVRCDKDFGTANEKRSVEQGYRDVIERWQGMKRKRAHHVRGVKDVRHLPVRQRAKRQWQPAVASNDTWLARDSLEELTYAQSTLSLADPLLPKQWHLINTVMPEIELNVTGLWGKDVNGKGVKVAIIDDGLDMHSDDLAENFYAEGSWDFNDHTELPEPRLSDDQHGTRCAGEIAAVPNDVCGVGVAYRAQVAGLRILSAPISDADEAAALNYEYQKNEIYSCSWGPPDDGKSMEAPENLILKAMVNGVQKGRGGKGSVFVFAAGNGGGLDDQCNFDGYTNSIFSLTIGAVDRKGLHPYYSEMCAAMLVVAPSSGSGDHIHTTDVGKDKCSDLHGGTSAAAPLVVGVVALALQVRPDLTWRDVQHLMVRTAVHFNKDDPDWEMTAVGRPFSYKYGYGRVDAGAFVVAARDWDLVKPQAWFDSPAVYLANDSTKRQEIDPAVPDDTPDGTVVEPDVVVPAPAPPSGALITEKGITSSYTITQDMLDDLNFERLEHVTVRVWIEHERRGDVEIELTSPNGVVSVLARQRRFDLSDEGFNGWKFMSMKHWDENPVGEWTIRVLDRINPETTGRFKFWSLQLWGEAVDASKAKLWSPAAVGEEDEEQVGSEPVEPTTTAQKPKPTNLLPGDHGQAEGEAHKPGLGDPAPNPPGEDIEAPNDNDDIGVVEAGADEGYFKGIDTLAHKTSVIAGVGGFIILAAAAGGLYFFLRSRRKRSLFRDLSEGERGSYEPVSDSMQMGLLSGRKNNGANGGSKDLYDAFAEGDITDDEEEGGSERGAALGYHDSFLDDEEGDDEERERNRPEEGENENTVERRDNADQAEASTPPSSTSTPRPEAGDRLLTP